jgi:hypothetical protein
VEAEAVEALAEETPRPPRHGRKRIAETSRESYDRIRPDLAAHCSRTRAALAEYIAAYRRFPTSGELVEWLLRQQRTWVFDVNSVRPNLTKMKDLGTVKVMGKRICSRSGRKAYVWDVA